MKLNKGESRGWIYVGGATEVINGEGVGGGKEGCGVIGGNEGWMRAEGKRNVGRWSRSIRRNGERRREEGVQENGVGGGGGNWGGGFINKRGMGKIFVSCYI